MKKNILSALAICAALFGCQKNEISEPSLSGVDLHATIEDDASTKTVMDENNNIRWSEGDQIIAFMKSSYGHKYQVKSSFIGETYADFSKVSSSNGDDLSAGMDWDHIVAYYPYAESIKCAKSGNNYALNVILPSEQTYAAESFGNGYWPMAAVSEDNDITFKNVCGGLKLQLKGTQKVKSITLQGKNNEKISGAATVIAYTDSKTKPAITMASTASTTVTLKCAEPVQLNEVTATEFIITLPPVVFTNGFTVTVNDDASMTYTIETEKANTVLRSSILNMPAFRLTGGKPTEEGTGDFSLTVKNVGADYVEIFVTSPKTVEMAYILTEDAQLVTPAVLFATGTVVTVDPGQTLKITEDVCQDKEYHLYAVAKLDDANFSETVVLDFKTKKYEFDEMITIVETYYDGYKVHITVPQATKDRGNVIRTGSMPLAWFNLMSSSMGVNDVGMLAVASNGNPYEGHMFTDSTYVWNDENVVLLDENGNPVYDEETGEMIDIHDPMVPGEPTIIFAGECRYGSPDEYNAVVGFPQPTRDSWSIPCYDRSTQKWHGEFAYKEFFTKEPVLCDATVDIEIPEDEIGVTDANIYFTMSDGVCFYFYMVLDDMTYSQILSTYLAGNEDYFQWFLTSYIAFYEWGVYPETGNIAINAARNFIEPLAGGETYHVLATVLADSEGAGQRFVHKEFKTKEKTKVAPVIDVTAVSSSDPYVATFNIKAGTDSKGNVQSVMGAYWVCNYAAEFEKMFNAGYTYPTLLKNSGWTFTSEEIAAINSKDGLTLSFPTLDGEVTRMAVYGCNDEYTFNIIDETNSAAWADYKSPMADKLPAVNSELFTQLEGDWTATATLKAMQMLEDESVVEYNITHKSKINISASAPELPASLDASVYDLYKGKSKEDVDDMFEELRELSDHFTEYRLQGQNRLLCNGFLDFDPTAAMNGVNRLEYRSPYDLFVATDYSSVDIAQLLYDFGPKWYLQVLEDGSVIVPFHSMHMPPMSNWPGYPFYVAGVGNGAAFYDANESYPGFPVEISSDLNTITIKPIVLSDGKQSQAYYMNALGIQPQTGELELLATVLTDIVLTRGWTEPAKSAAVYGAPASVEALSAGAAVPSVSIMKSMTDFEAKELPKHKFVEKANVVTKDMVDETSAKILRKLGIN